ncbi:hypothetical protein HYC85_019900 [Camellia sinensis]|uniref:Polygalacturonase n=1 Tax=Camellia sinensis TaxID=4442 RepID=A0A7J7GS65_CAMSI|nr:hypothetical protein HYC85_019900 [Camellia sinensis]
MVVHLHVHNSVAYAWQSSGVKVNQVTYRNIKGTSSTPVAVTFNCSPSNPCRGIRLRDVQLTFENRSSNCILRQCRWNQQGHGHPQELSVKNNK